jgi:MFS family permease
VRRPVLALAVATGILWTGAGSIVPLLPVYARRAHSSDLLVGIVMAAFFAGGVLGQYPAGRLTDRTGPRPVLLAGLVGYGAATVCFLVPTGPGWFVLFRLAQGVASGAVQVASLAYIGVTVPVARRGRAFAAVYAGQIVGLAVGPLAGGFVGLGHMHALFLAAAAAALLAGAPVRALASPPGAAPAPQRGPLRLTAAGRPAVRGAVLAGAAVGVLVGAYEACWTLLLHLRGATSWQVGLSWTLFSVPYAAMAPIAGRWADRYDRRRLAVMAILAQAGFAAGYPFLGSVTLLLALGVAEGFLGAASFPAVQSLLSHAVSAAEQGRIQGLYSTVQTIAISLAAAGTGGLFHLRPWLAFVVPAVACTVLTAGCLVLWRAVPGRVAPGT